jgi:Tfp pilus assembly protein PilN
MSAVHSVIKFDLELLDIISECKNAGYEHFKLAFALPSSLLRSDEIKARGKGAAKSMDNEDAKSNGFGLGLGKGSKKTVEGVFRDKHEGDYDPGKVVFLPMKSNETGISRALAVYAASNEPVEPTLQALRDRKRSTPPIDLLDTEITLFAGLARLAEKRNAHKDSDSSQTGPTLLVRAGTEDTIVMFLEGDHLLRFESLRSITAFDPPETICSRVLLLQDEFGLGDAGTVVLLGEEREESLAESFRTFFPDTRVELLRNYLPALRSDDDGGLIRGNSILAAAVTLRVLGDLKVQAEFLKVNFLPRKLLKAQFKLPFAMPVAAMYGALFLTSLFFMYRYYAQKHEMEMYKHQLAQYPKELIAADASELQSRIDSLQNRTVGLVGSLDVLDSLLVGSDKWSRALSTTAEITARVPGIWIESWEENGGQLELNGTSTDRVAVVSFATQAEATIESLEWSDIRGQTVYNFTMVMKTSDELPNVARYFRDNVSTTVPVQITTSD